MKQSIVIAIGNPLRGEDGVAHRYAAQLGADRADVRLVHQLTPEIAAEIAEYRDVVFMDADVRITEMSVEPVLETLSRPALSHVSSPAEIVVLARALYGFTGRASLWRIPARDFSPAHMMEPR